jgi:hypothetical protein
MTEWMIKLGQAKKLLDAGALTPEEFDRRKSFLLPSIAAITDDSPAHEDGFATPIDSRWKWIVAGVGVACLGLATYSVQFPAFSGARPAPAKTEEFIPQTTPGPSATPTMAKAPAAIDLNETLRFASPSECKAGDTLERIFAKFDTAMEKGSRGLLVQLDAFPNGLPVSAQSNTDHEGGHSASAEIKFPAGTTWHGLRLSRLTAERISPPESDSTYGRTLNFLEPASKVQKTLNAMGFDVKRAPDYVELADDVCGGSMQIVPLPGGSALTCGWGC